MKASIVLVCICTALIPLLLLNGQTFTNSLVAATLMLIPISLCVRFSVADSTPISQRRSWRLATMLTGLLLIGILFQLPLAFRSQQRFNQTAQSIHRGQLPRLKP